jgi:hypothetical protein
VLKLISLAFALVVGALATSSRCDAAPVQHEQTGRTCVPLVDMFAIQQSLDSGLLDKITSSGASFEIRRGAGSYTLENADYALLLEIKKPTPGPEACRVYPQEMTFNYQSSIPAAYFAAFNAVMAYRKSHPWPRVSTIVSLPGADVILARYGSFYLVMMSDNEFRKDPSTGKILLGCDGEEEYWVDVRSGQVRPFNGCIEGGGVQSLPPLGSMPWNGPFA